MFDHPHRYRPAAPASSSRWWALAVLSLAQLMVILDSTIVNIALPQAQAALGFSSGQRQWVVTAYAVTFGGLLLLGGRLSDRWGQKRTLVIGLAGFAIASGVGGAAPTFAVLVAARAVQGGFGALLAPAALSLLTIVFTRPADRATAFGIFGSVSGAGAAVGLLLGGALTEYGSWNWCRHVRGVPVRDVLPAGHAPLQPVGHRGRVPSDDRRDHRDLDRWRTGPDAPVRAPHPHRRRLVARRRRPVLAQHVDGDQHLRRSGVASTDRSRTGYGSDLRGRVRLRHRRRPGR